MPPNIYWVGIFFGNLQSEDSNTRFRMAGFEKTAGVVFDVRSAGRSPEGQGSPESIPPVTYKIVPIYIGWAFFLEICKVKIRILIPDKRSESYPSPDLQERVAGRPGEVKLGFAQRESFFALCASLYLLQRQTILSLCDKKEYGFERSEKISFFVKERGTFMVQRRILKKELI